MFERSGQGPEAAHVVFTAPITGAYLVEFAFDVTALHDSNSAGFSLNGGGAQGPFTPSSGTKRAVQGPVTLLASGTYTVEVVTDNPLPGVEPEWSYTVVVRLLGGPDLA